MTRLPPTPVSSGISTLSDIWTITWGGGTNFVLSLEADPADANADGKTLGQVWRSTDNGATWAQANGIGVSWREHREPNSNLSVSQLPGECDRVLDFIGKSEAVTPPIFREIES